MHPASTFNSSDFQETFPVTSCDLKRRSQENRRRRLRQKAAAKQRADTSTTVAIMDFQDA